MLVELVSAFEQDCQCVGKHVPRPAVLHKHHIVPISYGGPDVEDNIVYLCPTAHYNIHRLLQHYKKVNGEPSGRIRKHFSDFVQDYARLAWAGRVRNVSPDKVQGSSSNADSEFDSMADYGLDGF